MGPKNIGVRELTYRLAFLASSVQVRRRRPPTMPIDHTSNTLRRPRGKGAILKAN